MLSTGNFSELNVAYDAYVGGELILENGISAETLTVSGFSSTAYMLSQFSESAELYVYDRMQTPAMFSGYEYNDYSYSAPKTEFNGTVDFSRADVVGLEGAVGPMGATGAMGPAGTPGGATGATGSAGAPGPMGATGVMGPAGTPGGATGATGSAGLPGPAGFGIHATARVFPEGAVKFSVGIASVTRLSTGTYQYSLTTPVEFANYSVMGQPLNTTTDTNIMISDILPEGFRVTIGKGDNGQTDDKLIDTAHCITVFA